jgi:hypothetical protein
MAQPFWQMIQNRFRERNPFNMKTYDPTKAVMVGGRDVTVGGQIPLSATEAGRAHQATEQAKDFQRRRQSVDSFQHGYPQAFKRSEWQQPIPTPSPTAKVEQTDMDKLLRMMFMQQLMAGAGGGDPPQPYQIQVGPAARPYVPLNMYGRGLR